MANNWKVSGVYFQTYSFSILWLIPVGRKSTELLNNKVCRRLVLILGSIETELFVLNFCMILRDAKWGKSSKWPQCEIYVLSFKILLLTYSMTLVSSCTSRTIFSGFRRRSVAWNMLMFDMFLNKSSKNLSLFCADPSNYGIACSEIFLELNDGWFNLLHEDSKKQTVS